MVFFVKLFQAGRIMLALIWRYWPVLVKTTFIELRKRYSGSTIGIVWIVLYPILFLSIYIFVYLYIFRARFPGFGDLDYVLYVFSGLVIYIAFMETLQAGAQSVRQNATLIKSVILPIEVVLMRTVTVAFVSQMVGLGVILVLALINGSIGVQLLLLPPILLLEFLFLFGVVLFIAPIGVIFPDTHLFVGLLMLLSMFLSPIGYRPEMLPSATMRWWLVDLNPVYYLLLPFRMVFKAFGQPTEWLPLAVFACLAIVVFLLGSALFLRFKSFMMDHE
jgi:homopolymeric O-antigen transport system permease protein